MITQAPKQQLSSQNVIIALMAWDEEAVNTAPCTSYLCSCLPLGDSSVLKK